MQQGDDKNPKQNPANPLKPFPKNPKFNDQLGKGPKSFRNNQSQNFGQRPNRAGGQRSR